jgi:Ni/Co efflux regulator RcnB
MPLVRRIALTALIVAPLAAPVALHAQERQSQGDAFTLRERVPAGQWIRVRNLSGDVRVRPSSSDQVEVVATKRWRRGDPKDVRIETKKSSDGSILVCAFWTENATCSETSYESHNDGWRRGDRNNDVAVDFEVRVPKGVKVGVWSVNGGVSVDGASSEVRAGTVNGSVDAVSTAGPVQARTVNGSVHATMGRFDGNQDLDYETVNGSVVAEFSGDVDADIDLSTVNGRFQTDWPVTLSGRINPKHLHATLGKGGRRIRLSTVNGNVELRKR